MLIHLELTASTAPRRAVLPHVGGTPCDLTGLQQHPKPLPSTPMLLDPTVRSLTPLPGPLRSGRRNATQPESADGDQLPIREHLPQCLTALSPILDPNRRRRSCWHVSITMIADAAEPNRAGPPAICTTWNSVRSTDPILSTSTGASARTARRSARRHPARRSPVLSVRSSPSTTSTPAHRHGAAEADQRVVTPSASAMSSATWERTTVRHSSDVRLDIERRFARSGDRGRWSSDPDCPLR